MGRACFFRALSLASALGVAQAQPEGERPPRPESASNAAVGGWCDALTGAKKEQCLREERERQQREPRTSSGGCEALMGTAREDCLKRGGPLDTQSRPASGAGATRPAD